MNAYKTFCELRALVAPDAKIAKFSESEAFAKAAENREADLLEIVRTLCCLADRAQSSNGELYPSPLADSSPLMIAARRACLERGFTAGGLALPQSEAAEANSKAQLLTKPMPPIGAGDEAEDAKRFAWVLPILNGSFDEVGDERAMALAFALAGGMDGRDAIDSARSTLGAK